MDKVQIRKVILDDAEELLSLIPKIESQSPYMLRNKGEFTLDLKEERNYINSIVNSENSLMLVAVLDEKIVGSLNFSGNNFKSYRYQGDLAMGIEKDYYIVQGKFLSTCRMACFL